MAYTKPTRWHHVWHAASLVFQGGIARQPTQSLVGGGNVPRRDFSGTFAPVIYGYSTATASLGGAGIVPARPGFLTSLLTNPSNPNAPSGGTL